VDRRLVRGLMGYDCNVFAALWR
jgi:hypothetical protein